jgi:transcriptional regulator with XRE-family HTH domain
MLTPLRRERLLRQMSLYDVRARTGISVSKLSLAEREIERLSEDEKRRLSKALGVQPEELFPVKCSSEGCTGTR